MPHLDLPLVPFEFFLFSMLLCFAAGMVAAMLLFLFVFDRRGGRVRRLPEGVDIYVPKRRDYSNYPWS